MAVNAYGQYTISIVDDGVGIKSKQDYYTLSNQKDSLDGAKSYFEKEVSGAIASFNDGAEDAPMGVVVDIDPVQDLNGYDNPWPGGGGKNKANLEGATNSTQHTLPLVASFDTDSEIITISGKITPNIAYLQYRLAVFPNIQNGLGLKAFNLSSGAYADTLSWDGTTQTVVVIVRGLTAGQENDVNIKFHLFAYEGSTAPTSWTPYSNICPISGWTGAKVTRTGRNLLDESSVVTYTNNQYFPVDLKKNTDYTFSTDSTITGLYVQYSDADTRPDTFGTWTTLFNRYTATYVSGNSGSHKWYRLMTYEINGVTAGRKFQLELGSTAHAYEPYTAVTHEIPFSTEVYGGTLNVETGELVVDRAYAVLPTSESLWTKSTSFPGGYFTGRYFPNGIAKSFTPFICSHAKTVTTTVYYVRGTCYCDNFLSFRLLGEDSTLQDWLNYIDSQANAGTPIQICYELATPITLTLTPVEIRSLLGDNNVFADTGDVSVTYINEQNLTWETEPLVPNEEGKYLWWKYKITKDDDSTWESDPAVIGMFSDSDRVLANIEKAQNTADFAQGAAQMAQSSANYAQDAADRAQQSANNAQTSADQANEGVATLRNDVASNYVTIADFSVSNESIQSSVTEVRTIAEAAQLSADTNYSDLSGNLEDLEGRVSTNETSISSIVTATSNLEQRADSINLTVEEHTREIEELQGYTTGLKATMNLTASGLDISGGDTIANTKVHINGDGVSIMDGDNVPAYFHGQDSKMINVEVTELLRIGNHKLLARSGGTNTTVVYVGDE